MRRIFTTQEIFGETEPEIIEEGNGKGVKTYKRMDKLKLNGSPLVKIDGCGMGCTMIKIEVLEKLWKKLV